MPPNKPVTLHRMLLQPSRTGISKSQDKDRMSVIDKYNQRAEAVNSLLCIGLDSALDKLPQRFRSEANPQFAFNRWVIEQTHAYTSAYKPNIAFYEAQGDQGLRDLKLTLDYLRENYPDILTI